MSTAAHPTTRRAVHGSGTPRVRNAGRPIVRRFLSVRATFGRIIVSALEGCRLRRARRDPAADQVELRGRERPADERHLYSFGGLDVAQELLEEEARVGVAGDDAQRAGGLRRG